MANSLMAPSNAKQYPMSIDSRSLSVIVIWNSEYTTLTMEQVGVVKKDISVRLTSPESDRIRF